MIFKNYINSIGLITIFMFVGYLVNPFNLGFVFAYLLIPIVLLKKDFLLKNLDFDFVLLLILCCIYAVFYLVNPRGGVQYAIFYSTFPPIFYLLGKYLVKKNVATKHLFYILILMGFVYSFSALVSVLLNFIQGGFAQYDRSLPMFWSGNIISATKMGSYFTLNMCIPALLIADQNKSKFIYKIGAITIFFLSLICVIRLGSRTQLGIALITSFMALIYVMPKQTPKKNGMLIAVILVIIFIIYKNISFDLNADWLSTFAGRMDKGGAGDIATGGGRTERWVKSIEYLFKKPLGWSVKEFGFSHNLWLDVLRASGVIPFILLIIFSVRSFFSVKKAIRQNPITVSFNVIILVYSVAFFLLFMVEPVFEGTFSLFVIFSLFIGLINKYKVSVSVENNNL